jgi:hypothetical protein
MIVIGIGRTFWLYELRPFTLAFVFLICGFRSKRVEGWATTAMA